MATSGVITSAFTARDIITRAMRLLGVIAMGEVPSSSELSHGVDALNWMLKSWQADGCNLWREYQDSQTLVSGTAEYTLAPRVVDVLEARYVNADGSERPLARWEWGEYVQLPNKTTSGVPVAFTLLKERDAIKMKLWPIPNAAQSVSYTAARVIEDVTSANENLDVPQSWTEAVIYNLADRLIDVFGTATMDQITIARVQARAADLYAQMRDFDRPASVFFS